MQLFNCELTGGGPAVPFFPLLALVQVPEGFDQPYELFSIGNINTEPSKFYFDHSNSNLYVVGMSSENLGGGNNSSRMNPFLAKYKSSSNSLEWVKFLSVSTTSSGEEVFSVVTDSSGNIYVTGKASFGNNPGCSGFCIFLYKYNPSGTRVWSKILSSFGQVPSLAIDQDNNIYISYSSDEYDGVDFGIGVDKIIILKYDTNGNVTKSLVTDCKTDFSYPTFLSVNSSGDVFLLGTMEVNSLTSSIFVAKYDSGLNQLWLNVIQQANDTPQLALTDLASDSSGNVYALGNSIGDGQITGQNTVSGTDAFTIKLDPLGNKIWTKVLGGSFGTSTYSSELTIGPDGLLYVLGTTNGNLGKLVSNGNTSSFLLSYRSNGKTGPYLLSGNESIDSEAKAIIYKGPSSIQFLSQIQTSGGSRFGKIYTVTKH
ncbi:hypothetical protein [Leptospira sarikeiensis]|uniref:hypothetical protein n=1 Tax=Leptospira sarikeiensis TaxID=2484943 RepID=UPI001AF02723|nr:hypothetical protein [Leptospira sarikeiensis]